MSDGPDDASGARWFARRRHRSVPARDERNWVHPSELPSFDAIPAYDPTKVSRHRTPVVLAMGLVVLSLGSVLLALRTTSAPATSALRNIASTTSALPAYARPAARSTVELVITENGHLSSAAAMVIAPGDLAVTTDPIPAGASITGSSQLSERVGVTLVGHDDALGFTVVRLSDRLPITPTSVLPASSAVLAISPIFTPQASSPAIAWANTTLGEPITEQADGVVSYLATPSDPNLRGFVDALAIVPSGQVVAVLSANGQWFSAQYVTRVAQAERQNGGCHAHLPVDAVTAQGGWVRVRGVPRGPAAGILKTGDIITRINGVNLDSLNTLLEYLYAAPAHHVAHLTLWRGTRLISLDVRLTCQP